jgi:phosphoglycolate phosphatase
MLLLFDIDGTLVAGATEAHRDALYEALLEVHGVAAARVRFALAPAGRTDGEIARAILLAAGVSAETIDDRARDVRDACSRAYVRLAPDDLSHTVLPGIKSLLGWLRERDDVKLGLVTGNFETVGRLKLERAGLGSYFASAVGAFGSDSEDRVALPPLARRRAGRPGRPYPRAQTLVIGDTPRDIACARADELRCVAVATGPFDREALAGADAVLDDGYGLREWLARGLAGS